MQRSQLEHLIRAAAEITNQYEFVIIGSQSILGTLLAPPPECLLSMEANIYPLLAPELADLIDGAIGELSFFHEHFGYYAQGVGPETAHLPRGWKDRLVRLQSTAPQCHDRSPGQTQIAPAVLTCAGPGITEGKIECR